MTTPIKTLSRPGAVLAAAALLAGLAAPAAVAQDPSPEIAAMTVTLDTLWVMIAGFLVFWMNAGFALVESGFCRRKNTVNILAKNFIVFAIACLSFWVVGFGLMFGSGNPFIGMTGFLLSGADNSPAMGDAYQGVYGALN
ncbi:MAG TPA: ammonia permease, partial [Candidatus Hydrogenedentes bacterium]|nr:ammonia permease [Candidatus Hydrogenedentota bacterium]